MYFVQPSNSQCSVLKGAGVYSLPHLDVASIVSLVDVKEFVVKQATGLNVPFTKTIRKKK